MQRGLRLFVLGLCAALLLPGAGWAATPERPLAELRHTRWTLRDGAPSNIRAIVQGRDGFLWLGTATGLYRFDGIRFERITPIRDDRRRSLQITALLAARNGDLWVGYDYGGIAVLRGGKLRDANPWKPSGGVDAIVQARDGSIWVSADSRGEIQLSRLKNGSWTKIGAAQGFAGGRMGPLLAAADGSIYVASPPALLVMRLDAARFERLPLRAASSAALAEDAQGRIWIGDDTGLRRADGSGATLPLGSANTPYVRRGMRFDRSNKLWVTGLDEGLVRLSVDATSPVRAEHLAAAQGLTSSLTVAMAQDREGNVWVGTESGLDRFSASNILRIASNEALVTGFVGGADGNALFIAGLAGVYRIAAGTAAPELVFAKQSIGVLCGDDRRLLTFSLAGNFLLALEGGRLQRVVKVSEPLSVVCALDRQGNFWSGMDKVYRLSGNRLVPGPGDGGLRTGTVSKLLPFEDGLIVGRASGGLRRYRGGREVPLWPREAQTIGASSSLQVDGKYLLVGGEAGLARWDGRQLVQLSARDYPFLTGIMGIHPTQDNRIWLIGSNGILRVSRTALDAAFARPGTSLPIERFGYYEDFRARSNLNVMLGNDIAEDATGRLWFATNKGLAYIDVADIARNRLAPPVVVRGLTANGRSWDVSSGDVELPAGTDQLVIDYTALSLVDPQANRFRYRLEGADKDWNDAQDRREALYTNLAPGSYRFRVIASNNDGVWNAQGATLVLRIAPRFYQTWWFALACAAAAVLLLWLMIRRRVAVVVARARAGVQAQLEERLRIARELHDTLLQGFQGLMLHFQSAVEQLPREHDARRLLEGALDRADDVLLEGRERVRALRETTGPVALRPRLGAELAPIIQGALQLEIEEVGRVRPLSAPVAEEIAAVVREAAANAVRHADARRLQIQLRYGRGQFRVIVRDDGRGIAQDRSRRSGPGHYGLIGMRERVERLGGRFSIAADRPRGTRLELRLPGRAAYA
ncbi:sensor histidine kinase [Sphingomonas pituitosa]|uniref:sensor histidine kinase n=1 Tax=Sphingomonas pituitosa TaxID=99597 RepID=UPI000AB7681F|nr:sensor histidine kinase [Sphingomonas pituitosa]